VEGKIGVGTVPVDSSERAAFEAVVIFANVYVVMFLSVSGLKNLSRKKCKILFDTFF